MIFRIYLEYLLKNISFYYINVYFISYFKNTTQKKNL